MSPFMLAYGPYGTHDRTTNLFVFKTKTTFLFHCFPPLKLRKLLIQNFRTNKGTQYTKVPHDSTMILY